eukprot:s726_g40.t1
MSRYLNIFPGYGWCKGDAFTEYPAWTPAGMIEWLFERCNRRHEQAVMRRDSARTEQYGARRAMLADFMEHVTAAGDDERHRASDALGMLDDISEDPGTPTTQMRMKMRDIIALMVPAGAPVTNYFPQLGDVDAESGGAHCDLELAVEVWQCPLRSGPGEEEREEEEKEDPRQL